MNRSRAPVPPDAGTPAGAASSLHRQPLYQQIRQAILNALEAGEWPAGGLIPSEFELARRYGVSQGTVRKAVEVLVSEGLLRRRQGKGTYVLSHAESGAQYRFLRLRPDEGPAVQPSSHILQCRRVRATAEVQRALGARAADTVLHIRRLLVFADEPVVLDDIWLAGEEFRQLTAQRLAGHSGRLYSVFETELGTKMLHASERVRAVAAEPEVAEALKVPPGTPLLKVERITSTFHGRPVELRHGFCRTDRHHYANEL
ncbi:MAG: GntR family transcriptional regulator [Lautropia sp.]|nr:GntR family transcriptional regulator [Lautropia sp.]